MKKVNCTDNEHLSRFDIFYLRVCDFFRFYNREEVPLPTGKKIKITLVTLWGVFINTLIAIVALDFLLTNIINLLYNIA